METFLDVGQPETDGAPMPFRAEETPMKYATHLLGFLVLPLLIMPNFQGLEAQEIGTEVAKKVAIVWAQNVIAPEYSNAAPESYSEGVIELRDSLRIETLAYIIALEPTGFVTVHGRQII